MIPKAKNLLFLLTIILGLNLVGCSNADVSNISDNENTLDDEEQEEAIAEDPTNTEKETQSNVVYDIPQNARKGVVIDPIDGDTVKVKFENEDIEYRDKYDKKILNG